MHKMMAILFGDTEYLHLSYPLLYYDGRLDWKWLSDSYCEDNYCYYNFWWGTRKDVKVIFSLFQMVMKKTVLKQ